MGGFLDDAAVAQRVLEHIENKTTDVHEEVWREPVANYCSPSRLAAERQVLRNTATPFCPSAALAEPGSFVARDAAGTALVAVRDEQRRVRVFRNACRHRGMQLAEGSGCCKAFVCRYHGWTYRLDGRLQHIPDEYGFPGVDKDAKGLVPVASEEKLGLVWVRQEGGPIPDSTWEGLPELAAPNQQLMAVTSNEFDVNWKVFQESFLEGYHIRSTHRDSFYPYGFDNLNVIEKCGRNSRITFPFQRIESLASVAPGARKLKGLVTYVYHLFPNVLFTILTHHSALVVLEPLSVDRTRQVTYSLTDGGEGPEALEKSKRDAEFVNEVGTAEDREVVLAIQRGIGSGANDVFTFGHFEGAICHFHRNLDAALEAAQ